MRAILLLFTNSN